MPEFYASLYTEGVAPYSPGFASLSELPWVTGFRVSLTPKGLRPFEGGLRPQIIWAQPLRGRRCSVMKPKVARKASQPWAVRRNAFGIKKQPRKTQFGPTRLYKFTETSCSDSSPINLSDQISSNCVVQLRNPSGYLSSNRIQPLQRHLFNERLLAGPGEPQQEFTEGVGNLLGFIHGFRFLAF
jgi:hypothetical protein